MASIVLLLSELLGGESASVLAADRYMRGHQISLWEFRPAVVVTGVATAAKQDQQRPVAATGTARCEETRNEESFEDLAVSRVAVDLMWP